MVSERAKVHAGLASAALVFFGCIGLLAGGTLFRGDLQAALPGSVAPDFSLRDAENHPVALSELRGDVVIVYFRGETADSQRAGSENVNGDSATSPLAPPAESIAASSSSFTASALARTPENAAGLSNGFTKATPEAADLSHLSAICHELHNPRVKVLALETPATPDSTESMSATQPMIQDAVQTLIDPTGDVARKYRIDLADTQPTFFVIDPSGVIRYRGNTLGSGVPFAANQSLFPATQPSTSCPQLIQTLLSSEAITMPMPGHL